MQTERRQAILEEINAEHGENLQRLAGARKSELIPSAVSSLRGEKESHSPFKR